MSEEKPPSRQTLYWRKNPFKRLANSAHTRQKKRGLTHLPKPSDKEIEKVWLTCGEECQICGTHIKLHSPTGQNSPDQAELDAIVPDLGYVPGNMAFLCHPCNRRKDCSDWIWVEKLYHFLSQHLAKMAG